MKRLVEKTNRYARVVVPLVLLVVVFLVSLDIWLRRGEMRQRARESTSRLVINLDERGDHNAERKLIKS